MPTSDFESGRSILLEIPEPVWREWQINGLDADHLAEWQAGCGEAIGTNSTGARSSRKCSTVFAPPTQTVQKTCHT